MKDSAKTILCFGDSNTWGAVPGSHDRYPRSVRWPYALQNLLGGDYEVISEGLPGRTLVANDPAKPHRTGITHLKALIESHDPLDLIIVMLGTNDMKIGYNLSVEDIGKHLEETVKLIKSDQSEEGKPGILILCPPSPVIPTSGEIDPRMARAPEMCKLLPAIYKDVAEKHNCSFLNTGEYISSSEVDGYHWDAEAHLKIAGVLSDFIKKVDPHL